MSRSKTAELLAKLNEVQNITHVNTPGYRFFADVTGNGGYNPKVYVVKDFDGGVTLSDLNDTNPRRRCAKIRAAIAWAERVKKEQKEAYADFVTTSEAAKTSWNAKSFGRKSGPQQPPCLAWIGAFSMTDPTFVKHHPTKESAEQEGKAFCQRLGRGYSPRYRVYKALGKDHWVLEMTCWSSCD